MHFHPVWLVAILSLGNLSIADEVHLSEPVQKRIARRGDVKDHLPKSFDQKFRQELKRFLEGKSSEDSLPSPMDAGRNVRDAEGDEDNYATVLQEYVSDGRRTRVLRVQRSNTEQGATLTLAPVEKPAAAEPAPTPPAPDTASGSGLAGATVIRAGTTTVFSRWAKPLTPSARRERLEAEMKFRQISDQIDAPSIGTQTAASAPLNDTENGGIPLETSPSDRVVVVEDIVPTHQERGQRELLTSRASWDGQQRNLSWGTVTQSVTRMAERYQPRVRMGLWGFGATAASVLLFFFFLHRKRRPVVAVRAYRSPVHRRGMPVSPPPSRPTAPSLNHPFGLLTDGRDEQAWQGKEVGLKELNEMENQAHRLLDGDDETEEPTVTGEIEGAAFRAGVQVSFDPKLCRWVIKKFSPMGNAAEVLAVLQPGTVVRGAILRTSNGAQRYRLTPTGTWIPTCEDENLILAVSPQSFRS